MYHSISSSSSTILFVCARLFRRRRLVYCAIMSDELPAAIESLEEYQTTPTKPAVGRGSRGGGRGKGKGRGKTDPDAQKATDIPIATAKVTSKGTGKGRGRAGADAQKATDSPIAPRKTSYKGKGKGTSTPSRPDSQKGISLREHVFIFSKLQWLSVQF